MTVVLCDNVIVRTRHLFIVLLSCVRLGRIESCWRGDVSRSKCQDNISERFQTVHALRQQIHRRLGNQNSHNDSHASKNVRLFSHSRGQLFLFTAGPGRQTHNVQHVRQPSRHYAAVDSMCSY